MTPVVVHALDDGKHFLVVDLIVQLRCIKFLANEGTRV